MRKAGSGHKGGRTAVRAALWLARASSQARSVGQGQENGTTSRFAVLCPNTPVLPSCPLLVDTEHSLSGGGAVSSLAPDSHMPASSELGWEAVLT